MAQQKIRIPLTRKYDPSTRQAIAEDIITFIQRRAIDQNTGYDKAKGRNVRFPQYTREYAERKGASRGNVDLVLSAKMFNAMKALNVSESQAVTIGFDAGTEANAKAEGNQKGTYGQPKPIPGKARPFLGLRKSDLKEIEKKYR